ncbi:High-affnity carbon uptake protein Hat/HatR [Fimbriiglobus ruber]|uniref:High-affnity carbon uptake protein Hat/HatR n=1 Tax=Fimbriiglobus ruber TaxID=1908690 RepID=A0A225DBW4_9BACT|nr:High-affnity carbon uptake protein Hat/HatR [Fimbriiglobus ruber]
MPQPIRPALLDFANWVEQCRAALESLTGGFSWLRVLTPPSPPLNSPITRRLAGHRHEINALACSSDGRLLVSGGFDGTVFVWDMEQGIPLHTLHMVDGNFLSDSDYRASPIGLGADKMWIEDVAHSPIDPLLAISNRGQIAICRSDDGTLIDTVDGDLLRFLPNDQAVAILSKSGRLEIRSLVAPYMPSQGRLPLAGKTVSSYTKITLAVAPRGHLLAAGYGGNLHLFDTRTSNLVASVAADCQALCFSPDGEWLATSEGQTVTVFRYSTGLVCASKWDELNFVSALAFDADGRTLWWCPFSIALGA